MRASWLALAASGLALAGAAPYSARLDAARCSPLPPAEVTRLGADWAALAAFVQRCSVRGPDGRVALTADVVRIDRAIAARFFEGRPPMAVPNPILRDATGSPVGGLPENFPTDPPGRLRVRFADWRGGWPYEIRLYQAGWSALAPHPLPSLRWDPTTRSYREDPA